MKLLYLKTISTTLAFILFILLTPTRVVTISGTRYGSTIISSVATAFAATFDNNLVPNADNTFDIGQIAPDLRWRNGNFAGTVTIGTAGGSLGIGTETPSGVLDVVASSTNSLVVGSNGDVGIGTTSPYAPLTVSYNLDNSSSWWLNANVGVDLNNKNTNGDAILKLENTVGRIVWGSGIATDTLAFSSRYAQGATSSEVVINAIGDVGIGTNNPAYKLDVSGDIHITGNYYEGSTQLVYPINLPNSGGSGQWVQLGTLTIPQGGNSAYITVVSNNGYNAEISQNFEVHIRFKTSNGSSVDANGFCGDSSYYTTGESATFASSGGIKWVANASGCSATAYTLYMYFYPYTGSGSFYTVQSSQGTWVNSGALGQTDPGAASATVEIPINQMSIQSNVGIGTSASASTSTPLIVNGIIHTLAGGIEFPDGTIQTTAGGGNPATGTETFSTPGSFSFTVPSGVNRVAVSMQGGGGGGGGGCSTSAYFGGGGGGGEYVVALFSVTSGQVISGTVGGGGAGGAPGSGIVGGTGGSSSFNGVSATGGGGGTSCAGAGGAGGGVGGGATGGPGGNGKYENLSLPTSTAELFALGGGGGPYGEGGGGSTSAWYGGYGGSMQGAPGYAGSSCPYGGTYGDGGGTGFLSSGSGCTGGAGSYGGGGAGGWDNGYYGGAGGNGYVKINW